jgi:hypothetical protein
MGLATESENVPGATLGLFFVTGDLFLLSRHPTPPAIGLRRMIDARVALTRKTQQNAPLTTQVPQGEP